MALKTNPTHDPFSRVLDALWDRLEGEADLMALVRPGNRLQRMGAPRASKTRHQDADLPQLEVRSMGMEGVSLWPSSDTVLLPRDYQIGVVTGSRDETANLYPVEWELIRALVRLAIKNDPEEPPLGLSFVKRIAVSSVEETEHTRGEPAPLARGRSGWIAILAVQILLAFNRKTHFLDDNPRFE